MDNDEIKINELEKENDLLNKKISEINDESLKIDGAKELLLEYNEALKKQKTENENIKENIDELVLELEKLPEFIKAKYIKDEDVKKMIKKS